jgi:hypothetical protein
MENKISECRRMFSCILLLLLISAICRAAEPGYSIIDISNTGKSSLGKSYRYTITGDTVYWFTNDECNESKSELKIIATSTMTKLSDTIRIKIPGEIEITDLPAIAISGNYLILIDDYLYNQYRFVRDNKQFRFLNMIRTVEGCPVNKIESIGNNKFLFSCIYNFTPDQKNHNTNLAIYDAATDQLGTFIHPDMPCIAFSHLEQHWIAHNETTIALAMPCDYKIMLYDMGLNVRDSIVFNQPGWKNPPGNKLPFITDPSQVHPKLIIDKLISLTDTFSRIEGIYFADDSTLVASSLNRKKQNKQIDFWNIKNKLRPAVTGFSKCEYENEDTITAVRPLGLLTGEFESEIFNRKIITFSREEFNPVTNMRYADFKKLQNEYYENNDPHYSIAVADLVIPGR